MMGGNHLILLIAIILPSITLNFVSASSKGVRINRILLRRSSRTAIPLHLSTKPRQRLTRYVPQQPEQPPQQQQQPESLQDIQQQQLTPDTDIESELEFLMNALQQQQQEEQQDQQQNEQQPMHSMPSTGGGGGGSVPSMYTTLPYGGYSPAGTAAPPAAPTVQQKEEDMPPRRSPPAGLAAAGVEIDLSQKSFIPQMHEMMDHTYAVPGAGSGGGSSRANGARNGGSVPAGYSSRGHKNGGGSHADYDMGFDSGLDMIDMMRLTIRGEPGKDYPILSDIPLTQFSCADQDLPGYYADVETRCQVFHICQSDGRHDAFLCPNGTIFSQRHFVCVWWYEFECQDAPAFYGLNAELYKEVDTSAHSMPLTNGDNSQPITGENMQNYGNGGRQSSRQSSMYPEQQQIIDGFDMTPMTTPPPPPPPMYYSRPRQSKPSSPSSSMPNYGYAKEKTNRKKLTSKYVPSYGGVGGGSVPTVTPSPIDMYETTPYNLDAALGEEIHSETPLIESLPLTTILPHVEKVVDLAIASRKTAAKQQQQQQPSYYAPNNVYGTKKPAGGSRPSPYGGNKKNGKMPISGGSVPTYGMANGSASPPPAPSAAAPSPPLSPASTVAARKNGGGGNIYKPTYQPSYGTKI